MRGLFRSISQAAPPEIAKPAMQPLRVSTSNRQFYFVFGGLTTVWVVTSVQYALYSEWWSIPSNGASLMAILSGLVTSWILTPFLHTETEHVWHLQALRGRLLRWPLVLGVVTLNGTLGIAAGVLVMNKLVFPELAAEAGNLRTLFLGSVIANVLITQVAGWALQAFLTFLVATLLGGTGSPRYYFQLVGLAYVGYLLLTIVLGIYNELILDRGVTLDQLNETIVDHHFHVYSKSTEYLVLSLIGGGIFTRERFDFLKSMTCAVMPSFLLLTLTSILQWLLP